MQAGTEHFELLQIFPSKANELLDVVEPDLIEMRQTTNTGQLDAEVSAQYASLLLN